MSTSLWLVPAVMVLGAILLSEVMLILDTRFQVPLVPAPLSTLEVTPTAARAILAAIAGSMITVASLVFSITLVALQLASSQFGPRLINRFMHDRINQIVLGTFLATFLYALLALRGVGETTGEFVPRVSLLVALLLAMSSLGWLVYFIHHVAETIQADTIIADMGKEVRNALPRMFPVTDLPPEQLAVEPPPIAQRLKHAEAGTIAFKSSGYIQAVDIGALLRLACERDAVIELDRRPGHYAVAGAPAAFVWPQGAVDEEVAKGVRGAMVLGYRRTPLQDIEFAFSSLVSIALRALSPALNDPITASTCIDYLTSGLAELMRRQPQPSFVSDENGKLRLILHPLSFAQILDFVVYRMRQTAGGQVGVLIHLAEALTTLASFTQNEEQRQSLIKHAQAIERTCRDTIKDEQDRADANARIARLRRTLGTG